MTGFLHKLLYGNDALDAVKSFAGLTIGVGGLTTIGSMDGGLANSAAPTPEMAPTVSLDPTISSGPTMPGMEP